MFLHPSLASDSDEAGAPVTEATKSIVPGNRRCNQTSAHSLSFGRLHSQSHRHVRCNKRSRRRASSVKRKELPLKGAVGRLRYGTHSHEPDSRGSSQPMDVSGTLHFYSGDDEELFFVFDDDVAQILYANTKFDIEDVNSRRAWISVGLDRFIHRRTLSFSRKQTEIKISLCSRATKDGLGTLTSLYDWYSARGKPRPAPFPILGSLRKVPHDGESVWELRITEPVGLVVPPGLNRRTKRAPPERRSYEHRRQFMNRDLAAVGGVAEKVALDLAKSDFPVPTYDCLWRDKYLDSERIEIRKIGVIADIDVWDVARGSAELFIEVKAQKVRASGTNPAFYLSVGEWRSYGAAAKVSVPYQIWLFQYRQLEDFASARRRIELVVFDTIDEAWLQPDGYLLTPTPSAGTRYAIA